MVQRDVVVVGASAGGVEAITKLLAPLPADLPACILVALHTPASGVNALASILARSTALEVIGAGGETPLRPGTVIVAHPDHHLLVVDGQAVLTRGPRENGHRPAIDVLFRSAARSLGPRVIGVVLSGALDDGSAGLVSISGRGGLTVVQDPRDAAQPGMPTHAIAAVTPDLVLPVAEIPAALQKLIGTETAEQQTAEQTAGPRSGQPNGFPCPQCHAPLFAADQQDQPDPSAHDQAHDQDSDQAHDQDSDDGSRYTCRLGHSWSLASLVAVDEAALESALWLGLRALEEKSALANDMGDRAARRGQPLAAERFGEQATESGAAAGLIRRMLVRRAASADPGRAFGTPA